MVNRPDVVEMWDVCARDPLLLIHLKAYRNTVPVPRHWCAKRKYLQGKRGFEKPPFKLPEYIARTGIMDMRQTVQEKDADKTLKTKMREKIRPKVGKVDIDYHKLHDAFFKYQTKPKLSIHGDLYYEGKEFEIKLKEKKPGNLSDELRAALGLPSGAGAERYPPPWLIAMQRYGPPPSYPNLKIPGLNAPIPDGCAFGYHPGGWGKPPVDELGRPLYGDVFGNGGNMAGIPPPPPPPAPLDEADEQIANGTVTFWGELESDEESEDEDEGQDMDTDEDSDGEAVSAPLAEGEAQKVLATLPGAHRAELDLGGLVTPAGGLITPSGISSVGAGLETPQSTIELRKKTIEEAMEDSTGLVTPSAQLYRVLPERETGLQQAALMGSNKLYDVTGVTGAVRGIEAENPREQMLGRRSSGVESQQGQTSGLKSGSASTSLEGAQQNAPKKYKEFKF
ncbi:Splicing factor 3B subunit 2 [Fasciola gigantica]|uniref:Splicing factor 3B subunit 2 n=1 Tax=Fasciola gigantica TaxID=46835 RepID=A0A504YTX4_FASGI|nr:Splicing factor 3B subunit 2 [Fasciola gigantica]